MVRLYPDDDVATAFDKLPEGSTGDGVTSREPKPRGRAQPCPAQKPGKRRGFRAIGRRPKLGQRLCQVN